MASLMLSLSLHLLMVFLVATTCHSQTTPTTFEQTTLQESTLGTTRVPSTLPSGTSESSSSTQSATEPSVATSAGMTDSQIETPVIALYVVIGGGVAILLLLIIGVPCIFLVTRSNHSDDMEMNERGNVRSCDNLIVSRDDLPYPIHPKRPMEAVYSNVPVGITGLAPPNSEITDAARKNAVPPPLYGNLVGNQRERVQSAHSFSSEEDADTPANATPNFGTEKYEETSSFYANLDGNQKERVESVLSVSNDEDSDF